MVESRFKTNKAKRKEIGALWKRTAKNGEPFWRIKLVRGEEEFWFHAFQNNYKTGDGQPDFVIYEDNPDDVRANQG